MKLANVMKGASLALAAAVTIGASPVVPQTGSGNWNTTVEITEGGGHRMGNPEAEVQLMEFVSYTCSHCATFTREGEGALQYAYVGPGRITLEVRNIIRDPVDLTAAMLTNCGDPKRFPRNHAAIMLNQPKWIPTINSATAAQRQRWNDGEYSARRRAIARDFGFYELMERQGYGRVQLDRCLNDDAVAEKLVADSQASLEKYNISGTPSFAIDGVVLLATHNWETLQTQLAPRF